MVMCNFVDDISLKTMMEVMEPCLKSMKILFYLSSMFIFDVKMPLFYVSKALVVFVFTELSKSRRTKPRLGCDRQAVEKCYQLQCQSETCWIVNLTCL